ncbi:crossover junction endodeoxyribonuclease RuvC [Candidatus Beckwithbacteria bacterium]|nr:crossover junction endodeoxyribonuclease RuvC [Candidatus Beckwithbacteria bacterium]
MLILGVDPGYGRVGLGIIDFDRNKASFVHAFCFETDKNLPFSQRLSLIFDEIDKVIKKYQIEALAVESLFFNTNPKTALFVAQARGVILLSGVKNKIFCFDYTPLQVKQALIGYGKADKKQIQQMLKFHLGVKDLPKQDDACDALAVALTHAYTNQSLIC